VAYRLVVNIGDRALRFSVSSGEHLIGSSPDCAITIRHPTLSRRHASLVIGDNAATIEDLGSTNGTRVGGSSVTSPTPVTPETTFSLGSVEARLEEVGAGDLEAAVSLPAPAETRTEQEVVAAGPVSTIGPAALESFSLRELPALAERIARGDPGPEVAQAVAAALLRSLPCGRVEVVRIVKGEESVLFSGDHGGGGSTVLVTAATGDGYELRVDFLGPVFARTYEPLVHAAAALVRAACRKDRPRTAPEGPMTDPPEPPPPPSVVPLVRSIYSQAAKVATSRVSVLIQGESGTGKELLARYLHAASDRALAPLVTLNCAALPRDLLESELFGVERGVAAGVEARPGKFEAAHGGTLLLDEIGDMALETQAKILRVLQEGEVYRVGAHSPRPADVRVLSATNQDLETMLEDGGFRSDLYHRIADWVVELPPLRSRQADIPNLAAHFLARNAAERGVLVAGISRSAVEALIAYHWPGNVRQLEKEMARASLFVEDGELLDTSRLQPRIGEARGALASETLKDVLERTEREYILEVLAQCAGAVPAAADRLGIGDSTLYRRMKALGIE